MENVNGGQHEHEATSSLVTKKIVMSVGNCGINDNTESEDKKESGVRGATVRALTLTPKKDVNVDSVTLSRSGEKNIGTLTSAIPKTVAHAHAHAQTSNINLIIERSNNLCDRWHSMGFGKYTGTPALNDYLDRKQVRLHESPFTVSEMVQAFDSLRPEIKSLPPDSEVWDMVEKFDMNGAGGAGGHGYVIREPEPHDAVTHSTKARTSLYAAKALEFMSTQSNYQMSKKRKIHHLDGDQIIERLKSYENLVCELQDREERVMKETNG